MDGILTRCVACMYEMEHQPLVAFVHIHIIHPKIKIYYF